MPAVSTASTVSCECEKLACGVCEIETDITFYTAKCGVQSERVKSCKKPTFIPVEEQKACLAQARGEAHQTAAQLPEEGEQKPKRRPASAEPEAGEVVEAKGDVLVTHLNGESFAPRFKMVVYVGDMIETKGDGRIKVRLRDSSHIVLAPNSNLRLAQVHVDPKGAKRQVLLNLLNGKVRSQVDKKVGKDSSFKVQTRSAVAGVRGTEFITSFEPGEKEWVSEVRTISGMVRLEKATPPSDPAAKPEEVFRDIPAGTFASLALPSPQHSASADDIDRSIQNRATFTPLYQMKDSDLRMLKSSHDFLPDQARAPKKDERSVASVAPKSDEEICSSPTGRFRQCSWTCVGNPKGEKKCRIDLPSVSCVRRICNANGIWSESQRMPSSQSGTCAVQPVVQDCGNYW